MILGLSKQTRGREEQLFTVSIINKYFTTEIFILLVTKIPAFGKLTHSLKKNMFSLIEYGFPNFNKIMVVQNPVQNLFAMICWPA
jgi:hypothetical protein